MPLLKEPLDVLTATALVLGIVWLFIELAPSKQMDFMGAACALVAAFFYAEHIVMTRYAAYGDRPLTVIFYVFLVGLLPPPVVFVRASQLFGQSIFGSMRCSAQSNQSQDAASSSH